MHFYAVTMGECDDFQRFVYWHEHEYSAEEFRQLCIQAWQQATPGQRWLNNLPAFGFHAVVPLVECDVDDDQWCDGQRVDRAIFDLGRMKDGKRDSIEVSRNKEG